MSKINDLTFEDLKAALIGKDNYLFLVNDSNQELNQHFNSSYQNLFNASSFAENYKFKKDIFTKFGFKYQFFIIPDKSIICKKLLPFEYDTVKRDVDLIDEIPDFADCLKCDDYFINDSHISFRGGKKLAFKYINHLDKEFTWDIYEKLISEGEKFKFVRSYDLLSEKNWSFSDSLKETFSQEELCYPDRPKNITSIHDIPNRFLFCHERKSQHLKNPDSFSDLKVLIHGDSNFNFVKYYLMFYFKEMFFYWDHGIINPDVIRWFKPDVILEIRIERFLEKLPNPDWVLNKEDINLSNNIIDQLYEDLDKLEEENKKLQMKYKENKKLHKKIDILDNNLDKLKQNNHKLQENNHKLQENNHKLQENNQKLQNKNKKYSKSIEELEEEKDSLLNSTSWKITKPLRSIKHVFK